jgi:adenosylmethionine-8-amino-7-oxononanoate aminotransferase
MSARVTTFHRSAHNSYPTVVRAEGVYLYDVEGRRYLDASSGAVVANIGHGRTELAEVAARQIREVDFVHGSQFNCHAREELSERLGDWLPDGEWRFFAVSGGSEAIETAIKFARQYHVERGKEEKASIITRQTAYHGASLGALAASGISERRAIFTPLVREDAFPKVGKPDPNGSATEQAEEVRAVIERLGPEKVAAFLAEPIIGAADPGLAPPDGYYQLVRRICDEHEMLFVADEVMCGLGRAGRKLGLDHWNVVPDVIVLGKGLGAGYVPLAGIAVKNEVHRALAEGSGVFRHGYTYSGHPVSAAVGAEVLRILQEERLIVRGAETGTRLLHGLRELQAETPFIHQVRGYGMLMGVVLGSPTTGEPFRKPGFAYALCDIARASGLNLYPGTGAHDGLRGDHLLIAPPLTLQQDELELLLELLAHSVGNAWEHVTRFDA